MFNLINSKMLKWLSKALRQSRCEFSPGRDIPKAPKSTLSGKQEQACKHKNPTFRYRGKPR